MPVDQRHDGAVLLADLGRSAVDRRARDRQQPTLPHHRLCWTLGLDQRTPFRPAHVPSFRTKKSFSTFSWPICRYRRSTCASLAVPSIAEPPPSKTFGVPSSSCFFPVVDLVRMNHELTRQIGDRPVPPPTATSATFALGAALCFFRVPIMSCSSAIHTLRAVT
jgi:hypothetical protein